MKIYHILIFLLTLYLCLLITKSDDEVRMITDIIKDSDKVTAVVAHVCWKASKQVLLASQLGNTHMKKTIMYVKTSWANIEPQQREKLFIVADMNCPNTYDFFVKANATKKFGFPYRWLIIGKPTNDTESTSSSFSGMHLLPDADVIVAHKNNTGSFVLKMIYKISAKTKWIIEDYGVWTTMKGLKKSELSKSSISIRRKNFQNEQIKTAMVILDNKTISNLFDLSDVLTDTVTKSSYRQIDPLYGYVNASRAHAYSATWGYSRNGTHDGMIGHLTVGDSQLGGTVSFVTYDRIPAVEYLSSPTPISIKFVFRQPPLSYQNNLFLLPFKTTVWYCVGAFILVLGLIIYITALWESKTSGWNANDPTALRPQFGEIAIMVLSALSQQGTNTEFKGTLGRVVMIILFVAFLLLYSAYSASIVALLQSSSNQIRSLSDLLNSKLELGVEDTPYNRYYFPKATEPVRKAIYQTKIARGSEPKYLSLEEGIKKFQKEPFAFNMNTGIGYGLVERFFHEHEKCGLQEIPYLFSSKTYLICRKNSPYKEIFNTGLLRIQEHGLSARENSLLYTRKPYCQSRGGSFVSVNMVDFHPVLLMYLYGILLAFSLLAMEILVHRKGWLQRRTNSLISDEPVMIVV